MDTAAEIEEREDNDGNSAFYNTRTQVWGWTREEVEENIEERVGEDGVKYFVNLRSGAVGCARVQPLSLARRATPGAR